MSSTDLGLTPLPNLQVQELAERLRRVHGSSLVEIVGRRRLLDGDAAALLEVSTAEERILDTLIGFSDRAERAALLPDAFTPAASASAEQVGGASKLRVF